MGVINMTRTTLSKLERYKEMKAGPRWWTNPNGHPLPTLPDQEHLEGHWLSEIRRSSPHLTDRAEQLVTLVVRERQG